jgi:hypothetical protein
MQDALLKIYLQVLYAQGQEIKRLIRREGDLIMTKEQDDIDAVTAAMNAGFTDLTVQNTAIQQAQANLDAEIKVLQDQVANGQPVDTTALVAASEQLKTATGQLDTTVTNLVNDPNAAPQPTPGA